MRVRTLQPSLNPKPGMSAPARRFVVELLVEEFGEASLAALAAEINLVVRNNTNPLEMRVVGYTYRKEREEEKTK